jgi:hypothetical protein
LIKEGMTMNKKKTLAMLQACLAGLMYDSFSSHIQIFFPALADAYSVFHLSKHTGLSFSHLITHTLFTFLQADDLHHISIFRFSAKWSSALGFKHVQALKDQLQPTIFPHSTHPPHVPPIHCHIHSQDPMRRLYSPSQSHVIHPPPHL